MSYAHKSAVRSVCLVVAAAAGFVVMTGSLAQERSRLELASAVGQQASSPVLNPRHPETYTVQRGDTLWGIASMFLRDAWNWPEIWQINPQVQNPHLIFPGDVLSLAYLSDGRPVIQVTRNGVPVAGSGTVERLSPQIRKTPLEEAIATIPYETLAAFLTRPALIDKKNVDKLPYLFANRDGLIGSSGRDMYARRSDAAVGAVYNVVHKGPELVDPDTNEVLAYEGTYIGQGRVDRSGDPSTIHLLDVQREALVGDLLIEAEAVEPFTYLPHAPAAGIEGRIISVHDGVSLIGQYQVVVINRGAQAGLEPGHVLRVYKTGEVVRDKVKKHGLFGEKVRLPDEPSGTMMVFRTFDKMSYALVMQATDAITVLDTVRTP